MTETRPLHLTLHMVGAVLGVHPGAWRWPGSEPQAFASIDHWVDAARTAERGLFDAVFLSDAPGKWGDLTDNPHEAYFLEPTVTLTAIARATSRIGVVGTASTSFNEPYNIARRFQSLDLISHGRAGWNAVTTYSPIIAANFGRAGIAGREDRYKRGNEFVDVVRALWDSWRPGALIADPAAGRFADDRRLVPIDHHGEYFHVRGPLPLPASEQGRPVIFQAGASDPGRDLAARTADAVFSGATTMEAARAYADDIRARAARYGRDSASINILPGLVTSIAGSFSEAAARMERLDELSFRDGHVTRLAEILDVDAAILDPDRPVPAAALPPLDGQGAGRVLDAGLLARARQGATVRDLVRHQLAGHLIAAGPPEHVADTIEKWYRAGAADGFTLMPDVFADGLPAFVDHVVPILQRRGLWPREYHEATLRERLGLPLPAAVLHTSP